MWKLYSVAGFELLAADHLATVLHHLCIMQATNDFAFQHEVYASWAKSGKEKNPTTALNIFHSIFFEG